MIDQKLGTVTGEEEFQERSGNQASIHAVKIVHFAIVGQLDQTGANPVLVKFWAIVPKVYYIIVMGRQSADLNFVEALVKGHVVLEIEEVRGIGRISDQFEALKKAKDTGKGSHRGDPRTPFLLLAIVLVVSVALLNPLFGAAIQCWEKLVLEVDLGQLVSHGHPSVQPLLQIDHVASIDQFDQFDRFDRFGGSLLLRFDFFRPVSTGWSHSGIGVNLAWHLFVVDGTPPRPQVPIKRAGVETLIVIIKQGALLSRHI
jgi:hypothetical protein